MFVYNRAMPIAAHSIPANKISTEFARRLEQMHPDEMVRAFVVPHREYEQSRMAVRPDRELRRERVRAMQGEVAERLREVDAILARFGGRRLTTEVNALGIVAVEATARALQMIAEAEWVGALLENQRVGVL